MERSPSPLLGPEPRLPPARSCQCASRAGRGYPPPTDLQASFLLDRARAFRPTNLRAGSACEPEQGSRSCSRVLSGGSSPPHGEELPPATRKAHREDPERREFRLSFCNRPRGSRPASRGAAFRQRAQSESPLPRARARRRPCQRRPLHTAGLSSRRSAERSRRRGDHLPPPSPRLASSLSHRPAAPEPAGARARARGAPPRRTLHRLRPGPWRAGRVRRIGAAAPRPCPTNGRSSGRSTDPLGGLFQRR